MAPTRVDPADAQTHVSATELVGSTGLPTDGLDEAWALFAELDTHGTLLGVSALERHGPKNRPVYLLRSVAVRPEHRGTGVGRNLVTAALASADSDVNGTATVALLTETADGYFDRFGFEPIERAQLPPAMFASAELSGACPDTARAYLRT